MRFAEVLWRQRFAEKIVRNHRIELVEVEQVLAAQPLVRVQSEGAGVEKTCTLHTVKLGQVGTSWDSSFTRGAE